MNNFKEHMNKLLLITILFTWGGAHAVNPDPKVFKRLPGNSSIANKMNQYMEDFRASKMTVNGQIPAHAGSDACFCRGFLVAEEFENRSKLEMVDYTFNVDGHMVVDMRGPTSGWSYHTAPLINIDGKRYIADSTSGYHEPHDWLNTYSGGEVKFRIVDKNAPAINLNGEIRTTTRDEAQINSAIDTELSKLKSSEEINHTKLFIHKNEAMVETQLHERFSIETMSNILDSTSEEQVNDEVKRVLPTDMDWDCD